MQRRKNELGNFNLTSDERLSVVESPSETESHQDPESQLRRMQSLSFSPLVPGRMQEDVPAADVFLQ